jgi:subtilisin family serine protease
MDEIIPIPDAELEPEDEFDFIKKISTIFVGIVLVCVFWFVFDIFSGDLLSDGPASIVTSREADFDSLAQFDDVRQYDGSGVSVCIVDSGIDMTHPDLANLELASWTDFVQGKPSPYDDNGHGTMMAGILVADGGLTGLARGVDLHVAKALSGEGNGSDQIIADAIDWCRTKNVDIISLSLGGAPGVMPQFFGGDAAEGAANDATDAGIVVIAAAGNDGGDDDDGDVASPGSVSSVICVGGVDASGNIWEGSSIGDNNGRVWPILLPRNMPDEKPEIVAPGEDVPVIIAGGGWGLASGTSASTVYVTAAFAILFEADSSLKGNDAQSVEDLKYRMIDSSRMKEDQTEHDNYYGYGLLQTFELVNGSQS